MVELQTIETIKTDSNGYLIFNNSIRLNISDIPKTEIFTVDGLSEDRFYLVSKAIWGTENFADFLMIYNNYNNPFYLPKGTKLKVPDLQYIQSKLLVYQQQNESNATADIIQRNQLTAKSQSGSNVQRSDGRLIFSKKN